MAQSLAWLGGLLLLMEFVSLSTGMIKRPNIFFIVADDLGWNDVGFHNSDMITPNIDKLANAGIILNKAYVQPVCSPSRSAFMSGYYPFKTGLQHLVILPYQQVCLPLNITILPQKLKELGYATHIVGKWHLGFCNWNCTPTHRGFDSFFGYYNAEEDYYTHALGGFLDYRNNTKPVKNENGTYSTIKFASLAEEIIAKHNTSQPLFLYLPFQAVHAPIEVPLQYEKMYPNIQNEGRRKYCGMVSALDEAIGNVTESLKAHGLFDNTLIAFTADNGGWIPYHGNNYPLRGGKVTIYEGGTRGVAFMHGVGLIKTGIKYDGFMHAVDWLPTLVGAAGGNPVSGRDGLDLWPDISTASPSKRTEFVYNLDDRLPPEEGHAAIRMGDYKLIDGFPGPFPGWYKPEKLTEDIPVKENHYQNFTWPFKRYELYNLKDDPNEHNDLSKKLPDVVTKLKNRLEEYKKQMIPAKYPFLPDPESDPQLYDNVWSPGWC